MVTIEKKKKPMSEKIKSFGATLVNISLLGFLVALWLTDWSLALKILLTSVFGIGLGVMFSFYADDLKINEKAEVQNETH